MRNYTDVSRRDFLKAGALGGAGLAVGCTPLGAFSPETLVYEGDIDGRRVKYYHVDGLEHKGVLRVYDNKKLTREFFEDHKRPTPAEDKNLGLESVVVQDKGRTEKFERYFSLIDDHYELKYTDQKGRVHDTFYLKASDKDNMKETIERFNGYAVEYCGLMAEIAKRVPTQAQPRQNLGPTPHFIPPQPEPCVISVPHK